MALSKNMCPNCQVELDKLGATCPRCRIPLKNCSRCRKLISDNDLFCRYCGFSFKNDTQSPQIMLDLDHLKLLETYLPSYVLDVLLREKTVLRGERKHATIVFADISGFTAMSEKMDPEKVTEIVNGCFEGLVERVMQYHGSVDKFIGDCLMAIWGVPQSRENDPELAVRACLEMYEFLDEYNRNLKTPLGLSVGINTGIVVAANVGSSHIMQYTVMGDTVNLAQRLESAATRHQILVTEPVINACRDVVMYRALSPIMVKGKSKPIPVFEIMKKKREKAHIIKHIDQRTPLIGRDTHLVHFDKQLSRLKQGKFSADWIIGEAGMGKTRLLHEFHSIAKARDIKVFSFRGQSYSSGLSYGLMQEILKQLMSIPQTYDVVKSLNAIEEIAGSWLDIIEFSVLETIFEKAPRDSSVVRLRPDALRYIKKNIFERIISRLFKNQCVLILVDDLHVVDFSSRILLSDLSISDLLHSIYFVYMCRPMPGIEKLEKNTAIRMKPFSHESQVKFLELLLDRKDFPEYFLSYIDRQSGGNPLYIKEIIEALKQSNSIFLKGGKWTISEDLKISGDKDTLAKIISIRLDPLPNNIKKVLRYASILGTRFEEAILGTLLEIADLNDMLRELTTRKIIELDAGDDVMCYRFVHPLLQETIYNRMFSRERKRIHGEVGDYYEVKFNDGLVGVLPLTVYHYSRSNNAERADKMLHLFTDHLIKIGSYTAAEKIGHDWLTFLDSDVAYREFSEEKMARKKALAHYSTARISMRLLKSRKAMKLLKKGIKFAQLAKLKELFFLLTGNLGQLYVILGKINEAEGLLDKAEKGLSTASGKSLVERAKYLLDLAKIAENSGNISKGFVYLDKLNDLVTNSETSMPKSDKIYLSLSIKIQQGTFKVKTQDLEKAKTYFKKAYMDAKKENFLHEQARSLGNLGSTHMIEQDYAQAIDYFNHSVKIAVEGHDPILRAKQQYNLGSALLTIGKTEAGLEEIHKCKDLAETLQWKEGIAMSNAVLNMANSEKKS